MIAPSLIPTKASDRVKTDRRDARQLARLFRAGELTAIYVPDAEDEAMRDLVRARDRAMIDQRKARQRLKGFLLRLGHRYLGRGNWSSAHLRYLSSLRFSHAAQQIAFQEYLEAITVASERLEHLIKAMEAALPGWKREPVVRAIALKAQQRLNGRYRLMLGRHKKTVVVVAALARELCGFVWAIACQVSAPEKIKARAALRAPAPARTTPSRRQYQLDSSKRYKN